MKVQALIALKADFPLPVLLQITGLARSTFFYHQARLQAPDPRAKVERSKRGGIVAGVTTTFGDRVVKPRGRGRQTALGAAGLVALIALSACTTVSAIQSGGQRNAAPANPAPVVSALGAISAFVVIVLAILVACALVLLIVFLRLRIAELKHAAPVKTNPSDQ